MPPEGRSSPINGRTLKGSTERPVATGRNGLCIGVAGKKGHESKISPEFAGKESHSGMFSPILAIFLPFPNGSLYPVTPPKTDIPRVKTAFSTNLHPRYTVYLCFSHFLFIPLFVYDTFRIEFLSKLLPEEIDHGLGWPIFQ